ncbi:MAG TPA: hypothetical protein VFA75_08190 [Nevskia sp.]|nr:hypothetical protein [Nevskia sp.]
MQPDSARPPRRMIDAMRWAEGPAGDCTAFLWLLKLGTVANLWFLLETASALGQGLDPWLGVPAQIFFAVSAYRCLFPVRYETSAVFHRSVFSSIFATRVFATVSEVVYIYAFSRVLRLLNAGDVAWVNTLSWSMVLFATTSQVFVWTAVLTGQFRYYFYEELGWLLIFIVNTAISAYLYLTLHAHGGRELLLQLSLVFGAAYLPWQYLHLGVLRANGEARAVPVAGGLAHGLRRAIQLKNHRTDAESWGGIVGMVWMAGYWATLIPAWLFYMVVVFAGWRD